MDRPTFPTLVALVEVRGCQPQVMPLRGLPDWYAIAIPAGYSAYIVAPDANAPATATPDQIEARVDEAARRGLGGLLYGRWSVRVTRGAWARLDAVRQLLVDVLSASGFLPMEPGTATVSDRARRFAGGWTRRLLAASRHTADSGLSDQTVETVPRNSTGGELAAHRPSYPLVASGAKGNGEVKTVQAGAQPAFARDGDEPSQEEA